MKSMHFSWMRQTTMLNWEQTHPLKVFIQLEGDCNGVYVTDKTGTGFTDTELQNGNSNVSFSWHILANRKNTIGINSGEGSAYSDLRFPDAPNSLQTVENVSIQVKEKKYKGKII